MLCWNSQFIPYLLKAMNFWSIFWSRKNGFRDKFWGDKSFFGISKAFSYPQNAYIASIRHPVCHRSLMNLRFWRIDWVLGQSIYFSIDFLKSKKWFLTKNFGEIKVLFRLEDCFLGFRMRIWYLEKNYEIAFRGENSGFLP